MPGDYPLGTYTCLSLLGFTRPCGFSDDRTPTIVPTLTPTPSYFPPGPNLVSAGQLSQERALA